MSFVLGMDHKLYYSDTPVIAANEAAYDTISNLIGNVRDASTNLETGEADKTTRANDGWRSTAATLKDGTLEWEMVWDTSDAAFAAIQTAWETRAEIALAALDGLIATVGSQGLTGNFQITNFSRSEDLEDVAKVSVTAKASSFNSWWTVAS